MGRLRIKFSKMGNLSYISHLNMMRFFERAIRRANIPILFSEGFNPHPKIVFSSPLSLGISSEGEYADFEVDDSITMNEFRERLSSQLPEGMDILNIGVLGDKVINIMRTVNYSKYELLIETDINSFDEFNSKVFDVLSNDSIIILKKTKSKEVEKDIRGMIDKVDCYNISDDNVSKYIKEVFKVVNKKEENSYYCVSGKIATGSKENLKCKTFFDVITRDMNAKLISMHKIETYIEKDGETVTAL